MDVYTIGVVKQVEEDISEKLHRRRTTKRFMIFSISITLEGAHVATFVSVSRLSLVFSGGVGSVLLTTGLAPAREVASCSLDIADSFRNDISSRSSYFHFSVSFAIVHLISEKVARDSGALVV